MNSKLVKITYNFHIKFLLQPNRNQKYPFTSMNVKFKSCTIEIIMLNTAGRAQIIVIIRNINNI